MFAFKKLVKVSSQKLRQFLNHDFRMGCLKDPHDSRDFLSRVFGEDLGACLLG